jgi:hypothetical protein
MRNQSNMLLSEKSILRHLPILDRKTMYVLDSLRFTLEMMDISYGELERSIINLSTGQEKKNFPLLFSTCWNFIDQSSRFAKLYRQLASASNHKILDPLTILNEVRNTYQHLDERIEEIILEDHKPLYGCLQWSFNNHQLNKAITHIAVSGIYDHRQHEFKVPAYNANCLIENILLETVTKTESKVLNISNLNSDIHKIVLKLEQSLSNSFQEQKLELREWSSMRDILYILNGT